MMNCPLGCENECLHVVEAEAAQAKVMAEDAFDEADKPLLDVEVNFFNGDNITVEGVDVDAICVERGFLTFETFDSRILRFPVEHVMYWEAL